MKTEYDIEQAMKASCTLGFQQDFQESKTEASEQTAKVNIFSGFLFNTFLITITKW